MTLTPQQRGDLERLIDEERRRFSRPAADGAEREHAARQLRDLEAARARLADGSFGRCVACGKDIELDRLIAHPTAVRCLACQTDHEGAGARNGDSQA